MAKRIFNTTRIRTAQRTEPIIINAAQRSNGVSNLTKDKTGKEAEKAR